jgi:hypothetical protein
MIQKLILTTAIVLLSIGGCMAQSQTPIPEAITLAGYELRAYHGQRKAGTITALSVGAVGAAVMLSADGKPPQMLAGALISGAGVVIGSLIKLDAERHLKRASIHLSGVGISVRF